MEIIPDLKKGSSGLRYVKKLTPASGSAAIIHFTCFATNKTSGETAPAFFSLDMKDLYTIPITNESAYAEGPPILKLVQLFNVSDYSN